MKPARFQSGVVELIANALRPKQCESQTRVHVRPPAPIADWQNWRRQSVKLNSPRQTIRAAIAATDQRCVHAKELERWRGSCCPPDIARRASYQSPAFQLAPVRG